MIIITSDNQIITTVPDRLDQSVIRIDAKRTRYREISYKGAKEQQ